MKILPCVLWTISGILHAKQKYNDPAVSRKHTPAAYLISGILKASLPSVMNRKPLSGISLYQSIRCSILCKGGVVSLLRFQ